MSLSMYQASVPVFVRTFNNLLAILDKAAADAEARKIDPAVLIGARLAPDMLPLSAQIQIASDTVKGCVGRLAGIDTPAYEDTEKTFPELQARLTKTIAFAQSVGAEQIDGTDDKVVVLKTRSSELTFSGQSYLLGFVLPNLFFHTVTAYDILRHNGVQIGKMDFLGKA